MSFKVRRWTGGVPCIGRTIQTPTEEVHTSIGERSEDAIVQYEETVRWLVRHRGFFNVQSEPLKHIPAQSGYDYRTTSVAWVHAHASHVPKFTDRKAFFQHACAGLPNGDVFEFGVHRGESLRMIAEFVHGRRIYGCDSFMGLPEPWLDAGGIVPAGTFSTNGVPPLIPDVEFVVGEYKDSLQELSRRYHGSVAFAHVDCDLHSSTKEVLSFLSHITPDGAVLVFDELIGVPRWESGEWLALSESGILFDIIGVMPERGSVAVRVTRRDESRLPSEKEKVNTAWTTTADAPPCEWEWAKSTPPEVMYAEEQEACDVVASTLRSLDAPGFQGRFVAELGCGRGACLRYALTALGAGQVAGLDLHPNSVQATHRALAPLVANPSVLLIHDATGVEEIRTQLGRLPWLVWSHGVIEHIEGEALVRYVQLARDITERWVAFSAPNPAHPLYRAFRAHHLAAKTWRWGFEEPLPHYGPLLRQHGLEPIFDGDVGTTWAAHRGYVLHDNKDASYLDWAHGRYPGIYTLVIAERK